MKPFSSRLLVASIFAASSFSSFATIVEFQTSQGNFKVNLFDNTTPKTVTNFVNYINSDSYNNTVIHRVVESFVVQGGGFRFEGALPLTAVETTSAVVNEPVLSNVKGTIAMAKKSDDPNSATNQWFFNLSDNSANLDVQNGGFTVFGQVVDNGMEVVEKIAQIQLCGAVPLVNFSAEQCADSNTQPGANNFVTINSITVIDDDPNSAQSLNPVKNTLLTKEPEPTPEPNSSGGGTLSFLMALMGGAFVLRRKSNEKSAVKP